MVGGGGACIIGTVQRDFLPPIFSQMDSSHDSYLVFKDFSNLASNSMSYLRFLIDSPLLFIAESLYSPYCLLQRVATLRIILERNHFLLELSAQRECPAKSKGGLKWYQSIGIPLRMSRWTLFFKFCHPYHVIFKKPFSGS